MLNFTRVKHLLSPADLADKTVLQVGLGSGGAPVNDHLTMNGIRRWILFDPDTYDDLNLVKHPRHRAEIGKPKTQIQSVWITDRNPDAAVTSFPEDVLTSPNFEESVKSADLILCCADKQDVRLYVNSVAVEQKTPCVTASVYRQGFGGEAYTYVPGEFGCFDCMVMTASENGWNIQDSHLELTDDEQEKIYGLDMRDFKASGLSMDIHSIAIIQARLALDVLLAGTERKFAAIAENWIIFYNRPMSNNPMSGFFKSLRIRLRPRKGCSCSAS